MNTNIASHLLAVAGALSLSLFAAFPASGQAPASVPNETPEQYAQRMAWFTDARFGLFIHWGVYSVPAGVFKERTNLGEWYLEESKMPVSEYERFADQFNPVKFDAQAWVRSAKNAGMKYIVITSKHHDGFGLWPSKQSDWNISRTPFKRDILKELADACQAEGIRFCLYHSIMDWHHPDWGQRRAWNDKAGTAPPDMDRYTAYMKAQLKELLTGYGNLGILWFDGEWEKPWTHDRGVDLYNFVRGLQPEIIVNNRVGKGRAGMSGMDKGQGVGDYGTPEQEIPATGFGKGVVWESCMTMNNHWGYNKNDQNWKSTQTLIRNLIDCASKGGNYLLNVGPTGEGLIPAPSLERMAEIGAWMKVNGEAIYGTTASPFKKLAWGRATQKPGKLYLHVFDWPKDGLLEVPITNPIKRAMILGTPATQIEVQSRGGSTSAPKNCLRVPANAPGGIATVIALDIDGDPQVIAGTARIQQAADGKLVLKAADAELVGGSIALETKGNGEPNIGFWTNDKDYVRWLVTISKPGTYEVQATFACAPGAEGSDVTLTIGDRDFTQNVPATKGWDDFATETLGELNLDGPGPVDFVLKASHMPNGAVVNLRSIVFKPAN